MNGTQARFLTLESTEVGTSDSCPRLFEHEALLRNENKLLGKELWSTTKPGQNRGSSGQSHSYDDHREDHLAEAERRFAHLIRDRLLNLYQTLRPRQFILVAESQVLGVIRQMIVPLLPKAIPVQEVSKDLCQFKPHELHDYLSAKELLPSRKRTP